MTTEEMIEKQIDDYIEKYCTKHHIDKETARKHAMVKLTEHYFKGEPL